MNTIIISILLVAGLSTGLMAEGAVPGDLLYPAKRNLNEKLESFLAITEDKSAETSLKQAIRRLAEAEKIEIEGKLDPITLEKIKKDFSTEVNSLSVLVSQMENSGNSQLASVIRSQYQNELNQHAKIYNKLFGIVEVDSATLAQNSNASKQIKSSTVKKSNPVSAPQPTSLVQSLANVSAPTTTISSRPPVVATPTVTNPPPATAAVTRTNMISNTQTVAPTSTTPVAQVPLPPFSISGGDDDDDDEDRNEDGGRYDDEDENRSGDRNRDGARGERDDEDD